jgi:hypothetical protein
MLQVEGVVLHGPEFEALVMQHAPPEAKVVFFFLLFFFFFFFFFFLKQTNTK